MSDRLRQSLMSSRSEIEAGLAEAGAELARVRQRAAELEELIALGTATLLAAEMISGGAKNAPVDATMGSAPPGPSAIPDSPTEPEPDQAAEAGSATPTEPEPAQAAEAGSATPTEPEPEPARGVTYEDDLRALLERAQP